MERYLRYFRFGGTATHRQYWQTTLTFLAGSLAFLCLLTIFDLGAGKAPSVIAWFFLWLWILCATSIRRCREAGISPHWVWLWLMPGVGNIFYIVLGCLKPDDGTRIARPRNTRGHTRGLLHYFSFFEYATRQEYWCLSIVIGFVSELVFWLFFILLVYNGGIALNLDDLFLFFEHHNSLDHETTGDATPNYWLNPMFAILSSSDAPRAYSIGNLLLKGWLLTHYCGHLWLFASVAVRRCRDSALSLWWALLVVFPLLPVPLSLGSWHGHGRGAGVIILLFVMALIATIVFGCLKSATKAEKPPNDNPVLGSP